MNSVAPDALLVLEAYAWPGNVRELQSTIKYAYIQSAGEVITRDCLPGYLLGEPADTTFAPAEPEIRVLDVAALLNNLIDAGESDVYERVISAVDRVVIEAVMRGEREPGPGERTARHFQDHIASQAAEPGAGDRKAIVTRVNARRHCALPPLINPVRFLTP